MTVANPTNVSSGDIAGGATGVTSSVSPTHNVSDGCAVLWVACQDTAANYVSALTSVSGAGLTWTVIANIPNPAGATRWFLGCAIGTGTTSAGALTITPNQTVNRYGWVLDQIASGVDLSAIGSWVTGTTEGAGTSLTPTVASADANGVVHAAVVHRDNEAITPEHTSIFEFPHTAPSYRIHSQYNAGDSDLSMGFTWTTASSACAIAVAVPAVAAGAKPRNLLLAGVGR